MEPVTVLILVAIGILAGLLSGFVGVGGGIIIVPMLMWALAYS
ncbi:MAG TPA: sulfite exporter TauE/SafE family protein, partial [Flavobacteriales bacterium]|nr:sulfite exporter TauE/SafE family protein [Flavobacteriales bacterium]